MRNDAELLIRYLNQSGQLPSKLFDTASAIAEKINTLTTEFSLGKNLLTGSIDNVPWFLRDFNHVLAEKHP